MKQHQPKVLIAGCSGFLGAQLVRESLKRQWKVIGISSRPLNPSNSPFDAKSSDDFKHLKLNLLDMSDCERLRDVVGDVDACVHSIGSLFDSTSYKSFKSNQRLLCSLISSFNSNKNDKNGEGKGQESALKTLNFDSAVNLLDAFTGMSAAAKKCKSFVYISTETHLLPCPWQRLILDSRYWKYKREFESILTDTPATFEKIVIRPGTPPFFFLLIPYINIILIDDNDEKGSCIRMMRH